MGWTDRFKNAGNPRKWRISGDDAATAGAAALTGGASLLPQYLSGESNPVDAAKSLWGDITGKTAAEEAAKAREEAQAKQIAEARRGQAYTQDQVDAGKGYIQEGTQQATGALSDHYSQAQGYMGQGYGQAQDQLGQSHGQAQGQLQQGYQDARGAIGAAPDRLGDLYGGGLAAGFQTDPGYQFRLQQGQDAIQHAASAAGGRHGGDTLKALSEYNQNFASNEFNNYAQRQMGLAGAADQNSLGRAYQTAGLAQSYGQNAAGMSQQYGQNAAGLSQQYGQGMAGMATQQGQSLGQLYSGQGSQLAGLGMQGAAVNAGITQGAMSALAPAPTQQGPSGLQQLAGLGAVAAGTYFGGPAGGMAAGQAFNSTQRPPGT
jgi:hypothetical protein